jgi:hypothetical protein
MSDTEIPVINVGTPMTNYTDAQQDMEDEAENAA